MEIQNLEEIRKFMIHFLSEMNDYVPKVGIDEDDIVGCFNTYYHGEIGQSLFYPPVEEESGISIITPAVVYILTDSDDIYVVTETGEYYNLDDCLGDSYELVFKKLRSAYIEKIKNE